MLLLGVGVISLPLDARGQWPIDGTRISAAGGYSPTIVSDGAGGAIVAWQEYHIGTAEDIYAQRVDGSGVTQWTEGGVALCAAMSDQYDLAIASDGAGGAIVTWYDYRSAPTGYDIYAQRVDAYGVVQWTTDGVALCTEENHQMAPTIASDGAGGAIIAWEDFRGDSDIYAQRVSASGAPMWTTNGLVICSAANTQRSPRMVADGSWGAIVAWEDSRSGAGSNIYVQRVDASGTHQWAPDGVSLGTDMIGYAPAIVSDGAAGAVVTWQDHRSGVDSDIYVRRINAAGTPQWTANGVALCTATKDQQAPTIASDGAAGAIVTWHDRRDGVYDSNIYAQRVDAGGIRLWLGNGVALCNAGGSQEYPRIVSDGVGGAIVVWEDYRNGLATDIYAQRVNASGSPQWEANGIALCIAAYEQHDPMIAPDDAGGAIVTWEDYRTPDPGIYAQYATGPLNAVAIVSFDAAEVAGVVTLRSTFRSDLGVEAVNVYRAVGINEDPLMVIERVLDVRGDRFEYVDRDVAPGQSYRYQIGVIDADGEFFSQVVTVIVDAITGALSQNQPNPFNPTTTIRFVLPVREDVTLAIYDANGHLVRTLVNEVRGYGAHEVTWDGRDDDGMAMGSGVYLYRLQAGKHTESKKMVLLK